MVAQERVPAPPVQRRGSTALSHAPLHGALGDSVSELVKLAPRCARLPRPDARRPCGESPRRRSGDTRGAAGQVGRDFQRHSERKPSRCQRNTVSGFPEQQRVAPPRQRGREQGDPAALVWLENWSLHFPCRHDELLPQKDVLGHQLFDANAQISRRPPTIEHKVADAAPSRIAFATPLGPPRLGDDTGEHETDLRRDEQDFKPLS